MTDPEPAPTTAAAWDALPTVVALLAPDGELLHVNATLRRHVALRDVDVRGHAWQRLLGPSSRRALVQHLAQREDFDLPLQWRIPTPPSGHVPVWTDLSAHWLVASQHFLCVLHDISEHRKAEAAAQTKAAQFRLLANNVPVLIAYYDVPSLRCLFANREYARAFEQDERSILGLSLAEVIGTASAQRVQPHVDRLLATRQAVAYEREVTSPAGAPRWMEVNLVPQVDRNGAVFAVFVLINDITRHRLSEIAVRESEERLAKFMLASAEGIVFHSNGVITDANPALCLLLGQSLPDMLGRPTLDFIAPEARATVTTMINTVAEVSYESIALHRDGSRIPVELIARSMISRGQPLRMTLVRDLRDRRAVQARIHHLAHHDTLTGLPNRGAFDERLERVSATALSNGAPMALLFIDLDHFKRVNDSLGHLVGDRLLRTVAARITGCLRATDMVARFGGDEFLVLLPDIAQRSDVEDVARKLLAAIEAPVDVQGRPISVSPSIGIALFPEHGATPEELIKHADAAMYAAKGSGRAQYRFFNPDMASSAYAAFVMEGELALGLERHEFVLHYQPQLHARDGRVIGVEALIRWQHPTRGLLLPDAFIPVAEQGRLIRPISDWVLREAASRVARWQGTALAGVPIAVNLSTPQFQAGDFVESVAHVLHDAGIPGRLLELELTERMLMADVGMVKATLMRLKSMGIGIAVDDFGTGYSSLAHLKDLPIDKMKIDRSFVQDLPGARDGAAIARAIIQMGLSLGITVVAEGVETPAQREFLAQSGCEELQGYLLGRPMTLEHLLRWADQLATEAPAVAPLGVPATAPGR